MNIKKLLSLLLLILMSLTIIVACSSDSDTDIDGDTTGTETETDTDTDTELNNEIPTVETLTAPVAFVTEFAKFYLLKINSEELSETAENNLDSLYNLLIASNDSLANLSNQYIAQVFGKIVAQYLLDNEGYSDLVSAIETDSFTESLSSISNTGAVESLITTLVNIAENIETISTLADSLEGQYEESQDFYNIAEAIYNATQNLKTALEYYKSNSIDWNTHETNYKAAGEAYKNILDLVVSYVEKYNKEPKNNGYTKGTECSSYGLESCKTGAYSLYSSIENIDISDTSTIQSYTYDLDEASGLAYAYIYSYFVNEIHNEYNIYLEGDNFPTDDYFFLELFGNMKVAYYAYEYHGGNSGSYNTAISYADNVSDNFTKFQDIYEVGDSVDIDDGRSNIYYLLSSLVEYLSVDDLVYTLAGVISASELNVDTTEFTVKEDWIEAIKNSITEQENNE